MIGDVYNTTVNIDGQTMFSSSYSPCLCNCGSGMFMMNSCFGFGYGGFANGLGMGVGYAAGMALTPALPGIFKGIGSGLKWLGTNVIVPAGKAVGKAAVWVGKTVAKGACAVAKGVSNLWNKIFHKKSSKSEKA